jgi:hypothetical protein
LLRANNSERKARKASGDRKHRPTYQDTLVDDGVSEDGYYRVEVTSLDEVSERYYFAWSNPVFARVP